HPRTARSRRSHHVAGGKAVAADSAVSAYSSEEARSNVVSGFSQPSEASRALQAISGRRRPGGTHHLPLAAQVARGIAPGWKFEIESTFEQSCWNDSTTLQNKLRFRSQENRTDFQHPPSGRQSQ